MFTYIPDTQVGMVRLLLNDVDEGTAVFSDDEIGMFLALEGQSIKRAAAQAIDTNASDQALAMKVLKTQDLSTDGAAVAKALREHADRLRAQADVADEDDAFFFDVVDVTGPAYGPEHTNRSLGWL